MHRKSMPFVSFAAALALVLISATELQAGDNPKFTYGNGQIGWTETTAAPQVRCVGGEPVGGLCSEGTQRIFSRSEVQIWSPVGLSESLTSRLTGPLTFTVNCNFNAQYRGPCWGAFIWAVTDGTWEGHWTAPVMDLMTYESELSMVGFGQGGEIDGMQLKVDGYSNPGDWYITFAARIKE
jgi:hypothetical protein